MNRDHVLTWLRLLGVAMSARHLYQVKHPRVVAAIDGLILATHQLVGDRPDVALSMVEERLSCDGQTIPGAGPTAARVFEALSARGYDRMIIHRGIGADDLERLVTALTAGGPDERQPGRGALTSTAHLTFSALDLACRNAHEAPAADTDRSYAEQLRSVWAGIDQQRTVNRDTLDALVTPLVDLAAWRSGATLPLATIASHDEYTATHISNVATLATALGEVLELPAAIVRDVGVAALLHDIGKLRVPEHVLNSAGRLTAEEQALVRRHPVVGARMLASTPGLPTLAAIVAFEHHLQAGGGGYPAVSHGWPINLASAITHVADVYDALRTNRPYRPAVDHVQIVDIMQRDRGTVFEPRVLDAFFDHVLPRTAAA